MRCIGQGAHFTAKIDSDTAAAFTPWARTVLASIRGPKDPVTKYGVHMKLREIKTGAPLVLCVVNVGLSEVATSCVIFVIEIKLCFHISTANPVFLDFTVA